LIFDTQPFGLARIGGRGSLTTAAIVHGVDANVLLQDDAVGELLMAHRTLELTPHRRLDLVYAHVGFKIALRGESPAADLATERTLSGVGANMHLQGTATGHDLLAEDALVRIG